MKSALAAIVVMATLASSMGCRRQPEEDRATDDVLVSVGDTVLTLNSVLSQIPAGLSSDDSAQLAQSIIDDWLRQNLLVKMASDKHVDMAAIEQKVNRYRNSLIVEEYLRILQRNNAKKVSDEAVKRYYDSYGARMTLDHPIVKGVFLKVAPDADRLEDIRRWVKTASPRSLARLEKEGMDGVVKYQRFTDKWIDWQELAADIPNRFDDPDAFLSSTSDYETTKDGVIYLLHINESLPSGSTMPLDFAAPAIREALTLENRRQYVEALTRSFYERAIRRGELKTPGYDPINHTLNLTNKTEK